MSVFKKNKILGKVQLHWNKVLVPAMENRRTNTCKSDALDIIDNISAACREPTPSPTR